MFLPSLSNWMKNKFPVAKPKSRRIQRRQNGVKLGLEALEERRLMAADIGIGGRLGHASSYAAVGFRDLSLAGFTATDSRTHQIDANPSHFTAYINWGDMSDIEAVRPVMDKSGGDRYQLDIKASHVYYQLKRFNVQVWVVGPDGPSNLATAGSVSVQQMTDPTARNGSEPADAWMGMPRKAPGYVTFGVGGTNSFSALTGVEIRNHVVGQVNGSYNNVPDREPGDYRVQINWGDNTLWPEGSVAANRLGNGYSMEMAGSHVYYDPGIYHVVTYITGPDGTTHTTQVTRVTVLGKHLPGPSPLQQAQDAIYHATDEFFTGYADAALDFGKMMTSNALQNQINLVQGIVHFLSLPGEQQGALFMNLVREAMHNPSRSLGQAAFNLALGKFTEVMQGALIKVGVKLPGLSELPKEPIDGNLMPGAKKELELALNNAQESLSIRVLTGYVQRLTVQLKPWINLNGGEGNCVLVSEAFVRYMRDGIVRVAPAVRGMPRTYLEQAFGTKYIKGTSVQQVNQALGYGTRNTSYGVIRFAPSASGNGHVMNWYNLNGRILYLDIQSGQMYSTQTISQYLARRGWTNPVVEYMNLTR